MVTWWHHKAKVEHVGGVKIEEANEYTKKGNSQSEAQTGKKYIYKKETLFPIKPGGGSRLSRLSCDWSIPEAAEQNKAEVKSCWCHASRGQSQSILVFLSSSSSSSSWRLPPPGCAAGRSAPIGWFWPFVKRSYSQGAHTDAPLVISRNALLCGGREF